MDEFVDFMQRYLQIVNESIDQMSDEEAQAVQEFIREALDFISSSQAPIEAPIPIGADLLWQLSNANPETFINYLHTVPDESLNALLKNPTQLQATIERLSQQIPPGPAAQESGIPHAELNSSNIYGFKYEPKTGHLLVRFQKGPIYSYEGVPPYIFNVFSRGAIPAKTKGSNEFGSWWVGKNPSLGAAFYELIRSGPYPYERVA